MRKTAMALLLCGIVAGCSQTTAPEHQETAKPVAASAKSPKAGGAGREQRCEEAIQNAARNRQNAAMAGTILSAAGGFGGYGGHGGAIVGQVASMGGSMMQAQAQRNASNAVFEECR